MHVPRILTGGQTGVDQAAWRAARSAGLPTGGWMPRGFWTEAGPRPVFAALYGASEHASEEPDVRTATNVAAADATLVLAGGQTGPGTEWTIAAAGAAGVPLLVVRLAETTDAGAVARWIRQGGIRVLHIAGARESVDPGIGMRAEAFLAEVFRHLRDEEREGGGHG